MAFSIAPAAQITRGEATCFACVSTIQDKQFFALNKSDRLMEGLFLQGRRDRESCDRPMQRTTLIDDIRRLKDERVRQLCGFKGGRWRRQHQVKLMSVEDTYGSIQLPAIGELPERSLSVVLNKPGVELFVELSEDVLEYLSQALSTQCDILRPETKKRRVVPKRVARDGEASSSPAPPVPPSSSPSPPTSAAPTCCDLDSDDRHVKE